jgi:hypothetical protein
MKMQTLYDQYKPAWDRLSAARPNLARMAREFSDKREMERALGYGPSVIVKWLSGGNTPSRESEFRAESWLSEYLPARPALPSAATATAGKVLLVACFDAIATKVERILAMLGCDVTEV